MEQKKPAQREYGVKINTKFILMMCALFFVLLVGVGILTRVLPQGAYERQQIDGQSYIVNGTYSVLEQQDRLPVWRWFTAPVEVLFSQEGSLVLMVTGLSIAIGGIYYVLDKADILKRLMGFLYTKFSRHKYLMMVIVTVVFLLIGSLFGITDEVIGIVPLMILLSISFGWDSLVGAGICFLAVSRGYAASTLNPYGTALAQGIAGVPLYSGLWLRFLYLGLTGAALVLYLLWYARRVERDPLRSHTCDTDEKWRSQYTGESLFEYEKRRYPFGEMIKDFGRGALALLPTVGISCLILGIQFLIKEGNILDTIIYSISLLTVGASPLAAALIILLFVMIVEIFLPGTLVKALTILPIVVPLGEFSSISRQTSCLIFAIGDSFPNLIYPTDAMLVMTLALIGCRYKKWIKWLWPYILVSLAISLGVIILALTVGY